MCSKGLGTNLGQGEVGIGVPVRCYIECNTVPVPPFILIMGA